MFAPLVSDLPVILIAVFILWIFWSTVNGPIVVQTRRDSPPAALAFMVSFYAVLLLGIGGWIAVFHQARRWTHG